MQPNVNLLTKAYIVHRPLTKKERHQSPKWNIHPDGHYGNINENDNDDNNVNDVLWWEYDSA